MPKDEERNSNSKGAPAGAIINHGMMISAGGGNSNNGLYSTDMHGVRRSLLKRELNNTIGAIVQILEEFVNTWYRFFHSEQE